MTDPAVTARMRVAPKRRLLEALAEELCPGGSIIGVRRLKGGISCGMHALKVQDGRGDISDFVLRRYNDSRDSDSGVCDREWSALSALATTAVTAPRPILKDPSGKRFGYPAIVTSLLPGKGGISPRDLDGWLRQLAVALASIHTVSADDHDLSLLESQADEIDRQLTGGRPAPVGGVGFLLADLMSALKRHMPANLGERRMLLHGDFWPGNTLWSRGRFTGVVDWEQAKVGDLGEDVGYCRNDIAMVFGLPEADDFLRYYEAVAEPVADLVFWDLLACTRPLPDPAEWLPGYHELGRLDLTPELMRQRFGVFARHALSRS